MASGEHGTRKRTGPSAVVVAESADAFVAAQPFIAAFSARNPRLVVRLAAPEGAEAALRQRFGGLEIMPAPPPRRAAWRKVLRRAKCRLVIALDGGGLPAPALQAIDDEGPALALVSARPEAPAPFPALRAAAAAELALDPASLDETLERMAALAAHDHKLRSRRARSVFSPPALVLRGLSHSLGRRLLAPAFRRLATAEALAEALGRPRAILCLGNGPSAEYPEVQAARYDALFRVNRSWRERGILARPDVVFTANPKAMALDGPIFGLTSENSERRLVGARWSRIWAAPTRFFRLSDVSRPISAFPWGHVRPSNGAAMLAAAVALRPAKLMVAGIDLFRHPAGAYPGDASTPNAYDSAHDADAEQAFIFALFDSFEGELVIASEVLREAWLAHRAARADA